MTDSIGTRGRPYSGVLIACCIALFASATVRAAEVVDRINWPEFLARHDLVWSRVPDRWESGAFLGNGLVGAMVYDTAEGDAMRWRIGRSDVVDRGNRLPIGDFVLRTAGKLTGTDFRLGLWNAELIGAIQTVAGTIDVSSYTHANQLVQVIELTPSAGEEDCHFEWVPGPAVNPRIIYKKIPVPARERNPEPSRTSDAGCELALQSLSSGGGHVTAWREVAGPDGGRIIYLSVGYSPDDLAAAQRDAVQNVNRAIGTGRKALLASHRQWWHDFWPRSFLSIPDTRMESFYWIQLYKMASGTRADRPLLDLMGPWFRTTPWPRIWWNLNIQLTYWPQLAANHLELGESLTRALDTHKPALARNARPFSEDSYAIGRSCSYDLDRAAKPEIGNLPWTLHNYYLQYRYSMDDTMLRERLFPLLKGSVNYYLHLLREGDDGYLHIPLGLSPEYPNQPSPNPDCNYDLALLRWGCETLLATCKRLKIDDPLIPEWRATLDRLVQYPVDENGYMVSASVPFAESHRHYSHLLMIYPLHLVSLEQPENRALVTRSLDHWMGMSKALRGYSFTGAASISALMGRGDEAARYLNLLLDGQRFVIHPNTMYTESGPVIETPLSGARSIQDMLATSWGDKIRIFPAVPDAWPDVTIHNLRTEGAFLVSAARRQGRTQFIRIESLAGERCHVVTEMPDPQADGAELRRVAPNEYQVDLQKDQSVVLTPAGKTPDLTIAPVAAQANRTNYWGLH